MHLGRCSGVLPPKPTRGLPVSPGSSGRSARSQPPANRRRGARCCMSPIGRDQKPGWGVTYIARVRIRLGNQASCAPSLVREGSGAGHGIDVDLGLAHESALKEAETDAMKRALMTFGNPFGLALYDKQQRQVTSSVREERSPMGRGPVDHAGQPQPVLETRAIRPQVQSPTLAISQAESGAVGLAALTPEVIQLLHAQVRSLSRPQLEALVTAFRQRFRLAEDASVAAAITQKQHHDWVEAYLVQVEGTLKKL